MRGLATITLALLLAGCSWIGGEPTEAEKLAERLVEPPDVLSDTLARASSTRSEAGARAGREDVEVVGTAIETDPGSALTFIDGGPVLDLGLPLEAGWAVVGRALDRSGFELIGSDRSQHMHMIRYDAAVAGRELDADDDNENLLASLAFWREEARSAPGDYRIAVVERGKGSRVSVQRPDGDAAPPRASRLVLAVLAEQLKP